MTLEKLIFIVVTVLLFILCTGIYLKNTKSKKKGIFPAFLISMSLGLCALGAVYIIGLFDKPLIKINFCTTLFSALGSVPAVITMLFINII